jgi:hypothetical protein
LNAAWVVIFDQICHSIGQRNYDYLDKANYAQQYKSSNNKGNAMENLGMYLLDQPATELIIAIVNWIAYHSDQRIPEKDRLFRF